MLGNRERKFLLRNFNQVKHVTLNPGSEGVVRIHMVPPKLSLLIKVPSVIILNGQEILPINTSWAILLCSFIDEIQRFDGKVIKESDWDAVVAKTVKNTRAVYWNANEDTLKSDLWRIVNTLDDIANGREPEEEIGMISLGNYAKYMKAPHRMDLMISSLSKNGQWNCNNKCLHCYAAEQKLSGAEELTTNDWKKIIDKCREAGIPQLTFTGGEPTLRRDLVELVDYSGWFITRLNTNGVCLTEELCEALCAASLDSLQVTLYSHDPGKHNGLVGTDNWERTVDGINNAVKAGLNVSINTPLCTVNSDYTETLRFIKELKVRYVSCSGLIPTGKAKNEESVNTQLGEEELGGILKEAFDYCKENSIDIAFTSPGWVKEECLRSIGFRTIPSCGACLSNMAVAPDGTVIPCQSWLTGPGLGNMLTTAWAQIWDSGRCREIRVISAKIEKRCQLGIREQVC
jgi:radical SAM protein with 4Fe4S-binding SPASM domain